MDFLERGQHLLKRLQAYPPSERYEVAVELVILWVLIFILFRLVRGSGGGRMAKGASLVLIITLAVKIFSSETVFERINFLYSNFLTVAWVALLVVFAPELRRGLSRLGEARFFRMVGLRKRKIIDEILGAVGYMTAHKVGALIVIERQVRLDSLLESGTPLDAEVSKELITTIFWPGSALHDMAMVVRGDRVVAAGVQLPLAEGEHFSTELGSRHRAAIGLSQEVDALVIVVSEETGIISVAERGRLVRNLSVEGLHTSLVRGMGKLRLAATEDNHDNDEQMRAAG